MMEKPVAASTIGLEIPTKQPGLHKNVTRRLVSGFAAQGFAQGVNLIIQIFSVPLFLHFWGSQKFGEWLLLSTIPGYFGLTDFGFANAAGNEMTMLVARGDRDSAARVYSSSWLLVTGLTLGTIGIAELLVSHLPITHWLHLKTVGGPHAVLVMNVLVLQVFFALQRGILGNGYRCDGNFAPGTMITNSMRLSEFLLGAAAVALGAGLFGLATITLVVRVIETGLIALDLRRRSPWLRLNWRNSSWSTIKRLAFPAVSFMGFPVGNALSLQGILTVVGVTGGPVNAVLFSTTRTLTRFIWQLLGAVTNTVWVELSVALGAGDLLLARKLHRRSCQVGLWTAVSASIALYICGPWILRVWTHHVVPFGHGFFGILLLVAISNSLWCTSYAVIIAVNKHSRLALLYVAATLVSIGLAAVLTPRYGLDGTALSLLVIDIFLTTYVLRTSLAMVGDRWRPFLAVVAVPPISWFFSKVPIIFSHLVGR